MNVKIFIAYHKESKLLKNEILEPIHVGRALGTTEWLNKNMRGDDIGPNISYKNGRYCELTSQYYIWKNQDIIKDVDYIGFCHYRRFFNFNTNVTYKENVTQQIEYPFIDDNCSELFGLNEENIRNTIAGYDLIIFKPTNLPSINVYQQYKNSHNINDYKIALKILLEKYPEYSESVKLYNNSQYGYYTNSYIMKKNIFNNYAEWLFSILFEVEKKVKYSDKDRLFGFLGERLLGIYITHLKQQQYLIKELQQVFVQSTDLKKYIPIVFACNNNYALHLSCAITSILENAKKDEFFYFYIINAKENLNYINKKLLTCLKKQNCIIKFITINEEIFNNVPLTPCCRHISKETYYRFLLPELFPLLKKVLYLDCDITVKDKLTDLFDIDITDYYMGGVIDILSQESIDRLKLKKNKYCNAGILLINLDKWRKDGIQDKLFEYTNKNYEKIVWQDQDVLNSVLQDGILYIEKTWNVQVGEYEPCFESGFNQLGQEAKILHHIGCSKPWMFGCKSPYKDEYFIYLNKMGWEYKFIKYNIMKLQELFRLVGKNLKSFRKKLIWFDKTNSNIIIFNYYKIKV